ncbi:MULTISPECIES: sodium:solute symporter family protein [unclassified Thiobacillus]|uniref:sodium:solute symporter family protein n=1 Tax=unclassified Thiobacillus TaxID=2646513 RepID=UPI0025F07911|nr:MULTISPECIES: sodium:solute symporter family protein [unclassified Thiobacillus]
MTLPTMLIGFVILYLVISIGVGMYAATRVHTARDYVVAGRHLPIYIVTATVFATWFGSETVLGIPATFLNEGLHGIVSDPFGSSMCLILVGLFFARKLYRMNLLTLTDYYRKRYGRKVEVITGVAIIISYLGWVSAQMTALGLVFNILSQGVITQTQGTLIGAAIVLLYTLYGGMWSVALTDFFQMSIIVVGLLYILYVASDMAGGLGHVVQHAAQKGQFNFWPAANSKDVIAFIAAWITMMFGSIPQQDVFQRVMSAKSENIAVAGSVMGGSFYFFFAFVPLTIAYSATLIDPGLVSGLLDKDSQMILPQLILNHMPVFAQIMFFGALLSAIMSTASGTLLAPAVTFSENIIKPYLPHHNDKTLLLTMRVVVVGFAAIVTTFALYSDATIYQMVENAYKITLVVAFVPLVSGLYWQRACKQGAYLSIALGLAVWLPMEIWLPEGSALLPPQFAGFLASLTGMVIGSLKPEFFGGRRPHPRHMA